MSQVALLNQRILTSSAPRCQHAPFRPASVGVKLTGSRLASYEVQTQKALHWQAKVML